MPAPGAPPLRCSLSGQICTPRPGSGSDPPLCRSGCSKWLTMGDQGDPVELKNWQDVARLVRLGIDDELLALLTSDSIPPAHLRQLHMSWAAMLDQSQ